MVFDQIAEVGILFLTNRRLERKWLLDDLQNFAHPFDRQAELFRKFFRCRLTPDVVEDLPPRAGSC